MPRAEVGSTKYLNNKLKSKGLQRLRWYCQACERQMRDENGFKCHVQSESHVRQMMLIGEDPRKAINDYSQQFLRDFLLLLRTSHGEKKVHVNHFYQEYIANKEHIHMNATKWPSLTELAKYLGREGICRVTEEEKGLFISWIDNSPDNLRRQDAVRKKERQDKGDEEREKRLIEEQIEKARLAAKEEETNPEARALERAEGEKIKLNFGAKPAATKLPTPPRAEGTGDIAKDNDSPPTAEDSTQTLTPPADETTVPVSTAAPAAPVKLSFGSSDNKPKNVFAATKKNPLAAKKPTVKEPPKKMSEAERIMKEEIERKRLREANNLKGNGPKRQKMS